MRSPSPRPTRYCALLLALLGPAACSDEPPDLGTPDQEVCLMNRNGGGYCIDVFEASRRDATLTEAGVDDESGAVSLSGRMPWVDVTWEGAKAACNRKNKRLCLREEWIDACDGQVGEAEGTKFAYGDTLDNTRCHTNGGAPQAGGQATQCRASTGTFDQSGNVWEWTGNVLRDAVARGGSHRSSATHHCTSPENPPVGDVIDPNGGRSGEVGFRCCRDQ